MKIFLFFLLFNFSLICFSQNLVQNGSFEEYTQLPYEYSHIKFCKNWEDVLHSSDYFHVNFDHSKTISYSPIISKPFKKLEKTNLSIPKNNIGFQQARTGNAYAGIVVTSSDYNEILGTKLNNKLKKNHYYLLEFYVSLAEAIKYAISNIGAYFSAEKIKRIYYCSTYRINANIKNNNKLNSYVKWMKVSGIYKAQGGEQYLHIARFGPKNIDNWEKANGRKILNHKKRLWAYYYIDDVSLYEVDSLGNIIYADTNQVAVLDTVVNVFDTLTVGQSLILEQISFNYNKSELLAKSFTFLDELVMFMKQNNAVKIEINGFTDNTGKEENNKQLSLNRAKAVFDYLKQNEISANRMKYQGFGSKNPIADNSIEAGRQKNRRVEIKIIDK